MSGRYLFLIIGILMNSFKHTLFILKAKRRKMSNRTKFTNILRNLKVQIIMGLRCMGEKFQNSTDWHMLVILVFFFLSLSLMLIISIKFTILQWSLKYLTASLFTASTTQESIILQTCTPEKAKLLGSNYAINDIFFFLIGSLYI